MSKSDMSYFIIFSVNYFYAKLIRYMLIPETFFYSALEDELYYAVGLFLAYCIVHRGPLPTFFSETTFNIITGQKVCLTPQDIADYEKREAVMEASILRSKKQ